MASKTTNDALDLLRRRQVAEREALSAVVGAAAAVVRARERRAAELGRLDAAVGDCEGAEDVALAVLAALVTAGATADVAGVAVARVRQAQQRASEEEVLNRVQTLTGALVAHRRRGRPRGRVGQPPRVVGGAAPDAVVDVRTAGVEGDVLAERRGKDSHNDSD